MAEGSALCPPRSLSISSSPPSPLAPPNILYAYFKCHPLCCTLHFFFFQSKPPVTGFQLQLLLVSLLSEKSTSLEASYQNLLQQGGRLKLSGMTCGVDGAGRGGDKCMANLWSIWIRGWGLWRGPRNVTAWQMRSPWLNRGQMCYRSVKNVSKEYFSIFFLLYRPVFLNSFGLMGWPSPLQLFFFFCVLHP